MDRERLWDFVDKLKRGVTVSDITIFSSEPKRGRFAEEINLELFARRKDSKRRLLYMKIFLGRGYYRDWIEVFGISAEIFGTPFFRSEIKEFVLDSIAPLTGRLFFEYYEDKETTRQLSLGVPPALTDLGFSIALRGFSYFRDWYFPEGLMEGGHKLQAEKPAGEEHLKKHLRGLEEELGAFLKRCSDEDIKAKMLSRFRKLKEHFQGFASGER